MCSTIQNVFSKKKMYSALLLALAHGVPPEYDVVVYGSTPAGIAAATAAGQLGMRVALFEPLKMIGGAMRCNAARALPASRTACSPSASYPAL